MGWMTNRRALAVRLVEHADKEGGGKGWVYLKDVQAWSKAAWWKSEAARLKVRMGYVEWYSAVLRELRDLGFLEWSKAGVYKKTGKWPEAMERMEAWMNYVDRDQSNDPLPPVEKKKVIEEELSKGTITIHAGPMPATPDDPTPPTLPGFVSVKAPSVELVGTPISLRPPTIITIDDLITHAESLALQVMEWHAKYQAAVVMLRAKESDVEAAMRMLSEMEEQVMKKNVELEEARGELITLQKQYEVAMDRARRAPIIPMINSKVTEDKGLTDEDKTPPTNGGGAAA